MNTPTLIDDHRAITRITWPDGSKTTRGRNNVSRIEAYMETDGRLWFAVFNDTSLVHRYNGAHVDSVS